MSQQTGANIISLKQPDAGQTVTIQIAADNMRLALGFAPDPNAVVKNGQDLEFNFEDGGKIVLEGYYDHFASKTLPVMVTESGDELSGEDFLASLNEDLLTAAGPGAGANAGGGAGEYADDPGALLDGVDRLGSLGTLYWGNTFEVPEEQRGLEAPGGSFNLEVLTNVDNVFRANLYEDARPDQHLSGDDAQQVPGQIFFTPTLTGSTVVTGIHLSGFPAGTQIRIGLTGEWHTVSGPDEILDFTLENFGETQGVYIIPPFNSDADITVNAVVDLRAVSSGITDSIDGSFIVVVDAVADLPQDLAAEIAVTEHQAGHVEGGEQSTEAAAVEVAVHAVYGDVLDGSERHFVNMENIPSDWTLANLPDGWRLVDADGNPIDFNAVDRSGDFYDLRIEIVDYDAVDAVTATGEITGTVSFNPHDWTSQGATDAEGGITEHGRHTDGSVNTDGPAKILVSAEAVDEARDRELNTDNNVARTEKIEVEVSVTEDVASIGTIVNAAGNENASLANEGFTNLPDAAREAVLETLAGLGFGGTRPLAVSSGSVAYDMKSDGPGESAANGNNGVSIAWDTSNMPQDIYGKIAETDGTTYESVIFTVDPDNPLVMIGTLPGGEVVLIGIITPDYASGSATVSFVQYNPFQHGEKSSITDTTILPEFGVTITDNDGDVTKATISYEVTDDTPVAGSDVTAVFDEKTAMDESSFTISGNVRDKSVADHDAANDDEGYTADDAGSDGFGGLVSLTVTLPDGSSIVLDFDENTTSHEIPVMNANFGPEPGTPSNVQAGKLIVNADGTWSFTSEQGNDNDITKDFTISIDYVYQDGDGDTATAKLDIEVKAAPLQVSLTGVGIVTESALTGVAAGEAGAPEHAHGIAGYTVSFTKNDGNPASGEAISEDITATMRINLPSGGASVEDFDFLTDATGQYIEYTYTDATGTLQTSKAYISVNAASDPQEIIFEITLPAGSEGSVDFQLPIADDALGGRGADAHDGITDGYTVEVTGISTVTEGIVEFPADPAENPVVETAIVDDGAQWDGSDWGYVGNELGEYVSGINDGTNSHRLDGPVVSAALDKETAHEDGELVRVTISLNEFDGAGAAPSAWTNDGESLAEPITVTLTLDSSNTDNGAVFILSQGMYDLIKAGKAILTLPDGSTYDADDLPASFTNGIELSTSAGGNLTVTLTESFNPAADSGKLNLNVASVGDNVVDNPDWEQSVTVSVSDSTGHESIYDGEGKVVTITDNPQMYIHLAGGGTYIEGKKAYFNLKLVSNANGTGAVNTDNIDGDVNLTLSFEVKDKSWANPSSSVAEGAEAGVDYLKSLADAINNPGGMSTDPDFVGLTNLEALAKELSLYGKVDISNVRYVYGDADNPDRITGFEIDLAIEPGDWDSSATVQITVPTIKDDVAGEPNEIFTVKVKEGSVTQNEGDQEIAGLTNNAKNGLDATITDPRIEMGITGDTVIWEESQNGETIAEYKISFTQANDHGGTIANGSFEFDVTLQNAGARYHEGDPATAPTDGSADYHWVVVDGDGNASSYDLSSSEGRADFLAALQAQLDSLYGPGNVTVSFTSGTNSLHFAVAEGAVLEDLPLYVKAIDDMHGDSGEQYKVVIGGLVNDPDAVQVAITDNVATTTILDGGNRGSGSGQWLGLERVEVHESEEDVVLAVRLYEPTLDGGVYLGSMPPSEDMNIVLGYSDSTAEGNKDYVTSANQAHIAQTSWIAYGENGNVLIKYENGWMEDLDGDGIFEPVTDWNSLGDNGQLPPGSYWEATPTIPGLINDDRLTEGDEEFNIWIESVSGNESAPKYSGSDIANKVNDSGATVALGDDDTNKGAGGDATDIKDGPRLESFVLGGRLREPEAAGEPGSGDGTAEASTSSVYTIAFTDVAAEDIIVELDLATGGAVIGKDFILGEGVMTGADLIDYYTVNGWPGYLTKDSVDTGKFYVIVRAGESSANFTIKILHDHDTANDLSGVDSGNEEISWTITGMVGSEVQWGEGAGYAPEDLTSQALIEDDMKGPVITIQDGSLGADYGEGTIDGIFELSPNVALGEGEVVTVRLQIIDSNGESHFVDATGVWVDGKMEFTAQIPDSVKDQPYFYVRVGESSGGETRVDPDVSAPFIKGGEGTSEVVHVTVTGSDIWEQTEGKPESVNYTLTITNLQNADAGKDISFTIKAVDTTAETGSDLAPGSDSVTVELSSALLTELKDGGNDSFTVEIIAGDNGVPAQVIVKDASGQELRSLTVDAGGNIEGDYGSVTGKLPTANDDSLIEGDELFTPVITNPSGVLPTPGKDPQEITIHDNDNPEVTIEFGYVDADGVFHAVSQVTEGEMGHVGEGGQSGNYVVRVSLTDGNGNLLELTDGNSPASPVTIILTVKGTGVNEGTEDVTIFTQEVTLYPGDSLADVRVVFPEDFVTDPNKKFTIEASFKNPEDSNNFGNTGLEGSITVDDALESGVTIVDHVNGPKASLLPGGGVAGGASNTAEDSAAGYVIKLDKVLEEAAEVPLNISFDDVADTADGMTPEDVRSITIGGIEYTVSMDNGVLTLTNGTTVISGTYETSDNGNVISWQFGVPLEKGSSGQKVTVNLQNDHVSEGTESLVVTIVDTGDLKGELVIGDNASVTTAVKDVKDGPDVSLSSGEPAVEGEIAVVSLDLTRTPEEAFEVTMRVADTAVLRESGVIFVYTKDGQEYRLGVSIGEDGSFTVPVPAGATDTKLEFITQDNATTGANNPLEVSITGVSGGEAGILGGASYEGSFVEESYNSMTVHLGGDSSRAMTSQTELTISLGKIAINDVDSIVYGGKTYKSGDLVQSGDEVFLVIDCRAGTVVDGDIKVSFKNNAVDNKKALDVSASETGSSAIVEIRDDAGTDAQDGPVFTIIGGDSVAEGESLTFTINPNAQAFTTSAEEITLTFKVSGTNVESISLGDGLTATSKGNGLYEVKLPAGTDLTQDIILTVNTKADSQIDTNSTVAVELTGVRGGEASLDPDAENKTAQGTVTESATTGAAFTVTTETPDVAEGENLSFTLALQAGDKSMTASVPVEITFLVSGLGGLELAADLILSNEAGQYAWSEAGGNTFLTVTLPAGASSLDVTIPTVSDGSPETGEGVEFEMVAITPNNLGVAMPSDVTLTVTVHDAVQDAFIINLVDEHPFDGSQYSFGLPIIGSDGNDDIIGSDFADTIIGGGGLDILQGGGGDDSFVWQRADLNEDGSSATDVIRDFSMIAQDSDTAKDGLYGNDTLDLRDLIDLGDDYTLDDFISISKTDTGSAILDIKTEVDGNVVQTIILENVYTNHAVEGNEDAVTQMIKEHIIINSGG